LPDLQHPTVDPFALEAPMGIVWGRGRPKCREIEEKETNPIGNSGAVRSSLHHLRRPKHVFMVISEPYVVKF